MSKPRTISSSSLCPDGTQILFILLGFLFLCFGVFFFLILFKGFWWLESEMWLFCFNERWLQRSWLLKWSSRKKNLIPHYFPYLLRGKSPHALYEYIPGGAGRFIPLTIRRCISVLLSSENILWKNKDKKSIFIPVAHHHLIHCQTRMPLVFVRPFSIVHSYIDHFHKLQKSKEQAQTKIKTSLKYSEKCHE